MTSRRDFIKQGTLGAFTIAGMLSGCKTTMDSTNMATTASASSGVQLYTVRDRMALGVESTLRTVAEIGYSEVEFANNLFGNSPRQVRQWLDELGLSAVADHASASVARGQNTDQKIDDLLQLGCKYLVIPSLPSDSTQTVDDYKEWANDFNVLGEKCKSQNLSFGFHNHATEFRTVEGRIPFDILLDETDPNLVTFEIDLFWVNKGGYNPLSYFSEYPGRFQLFHVKDMTSDGEMTEVGKGTLPFSSYFDKIKEAGLKHFFVEHDQPTDSFASIRTSYSGLSELLG